MKNEKIGIGLILLYTLIDIIVSTTTDEKLLFTTMRDLIINMINNPVMDTVGNIYYLNII